MKNRTIIYCLFIAACFCACNSASNEKTESTTEVEIAYNESIQNQFFGFSFGATPQEVNEKLNSAGLLTSDKLVQTGRLTFKASSQYDDFSFGGYSWKFCHPNFSNNILYKVEFMNPYKTKEGAASSYRSLVSSLSNKYQMQSVPQTDTTLYGVFVGLTKEGQYVDVSYYRYESVGHEMWYGVTLEYGDNRYYQDNNEL